MSIEALNCQCCGAPLNITDTICECEYCGGINIIGGNAGKYISQLNRANKLRQECEFDHAYTTYDIILSENTPSADVLWSQALCEYGIEYVPDPISSRFFPTLHRVKDISFLNSRCYLEALELADSQQKEHMKKAAEEIARIQEDYLNIAANEKPYDVFICYKEKDSDTGEYTEDVKLAEELYRELTDKGYKVFFSGETLKDKLSVDFEPYIFAALKSAKAMAVIGTKAEYFTSVWVKNEWGRFLKLMEQNPEKRMFFACDDPDELPRAFSAKQAQLLCKDGAIKNLATNIVMFLKSGSAKVISPSKILTVQDEFDRIMAQKAKEYTEKIEKTKFREQERSIVKELWNLNGFAYVTNKLFTRTFHIGSILLLLASFTYIFYSFFRTLFPEQKFMSPLYIFSFILIIIIFAGIMTLLMPIVFLNLFDFRKRESQELYMFIVSYGLSIIALGFVIHAFLFSFFPITDFVILCVVPLLIVLIGAVRWFNSAFIENKKSLAEVNSKLTQIKNLEEIARKEFFEFEEIQLENLIQSGHINDEAQIKEYHYDEVKQKVDEILEEDIQFIRKSESNRLNVRNLIVKRIVFTIVYGLLAATASAINFSIFYYGLLSALEL